ncbi:LysM peptidoglycan-binding domain-containing protein [Roseivirga sp.]|uniref:LysM peptidoglycan-binding domain-containing protein n=1 Tax=Roseivirga sp. TaxID=1964215 RepID=UPI003B52171A
MRKTFTALLILLLASLRSLAQAPITVPNEMEFAGVKLKIHADARKEIEQTLDLLTRSQYHFQRLVDRSRLYMPYVEQVLKQEGIPEDFKYLPIQESQFVSDTVSSSNAVGFWQFKKASAQELGLRVDNIVDERKHIIAATVGATKYFKRSNFVFDNWVLSLQSYLQGLTGTQRSVDDKLYGAKTMVINSKTHWYIKKFLAHYLAFQDFVGSGKYRDDMSLHDYEGRGKTLRQVSSATGVEYDQLRSYNKWLNQSKIPDDKSYLVFYPDQKRNHQPVVARNEGGSGSKGNTSTTTRTSNTKTVSKAETRRMRFKPIAGNVGAFPRISGNTSKAYEPDQIELNGIPAIRAKNTETLQSLATRTGVKMAKLRRFNDIGDRGNVRAHQYYYLKRKKNKGKVHYHIVQPGETLWGISQDYGIKLKKLMHKNRMRDNEQLKVGRVLWLRFIRPKDIPVEFSNLNQPQTQEVLVVDHSAKPEKTVKEKLDKPRTVELPLREDTELFIEPVQYRALENTATDTVITHRVGYQETFFAISREYSVEIDEILEWNQLNLSDGLQIGQEVKVLVSKTRFAKLEPVVEVITHEVQKGETMWAISRKYGVAIEDLRSWNNKSDNSLSLGEKLIIRKPK